MLLFTRTAVQLRLFMSAALVTAALALSANAAEPAPPAAPSPPNKTQPSQPKAPPVAMPDAEKIVVLIRTALLTLNDALETGNFTVLRDMGAPGFREANNAARLAVSFSNLMSQNIELSAVATIAPQLSEAPALDGQNNMLRLKGVFPGQPVQIRFDLLFQPVANRWRLFGISVQPEHVTVTPAPTQTLSATLSSSAYVFQIPLQF
jgi:hypothetical protein